MERILSDYTTSISELRKSPTAILDAAEGEAVALLNNNKPTAYIVPAELYEKMLDDLDEVYLGKVVSSRLKEDRIMVDIDEI